MTATRREGWWKLRMERNDRGEDGGTRYRSDYHLSVITIGLTSQKEKNKTTALNTE